MSINPTYLVGAGGIIGAILRHIVGQIVTTDQLPLSTLTVNVIGSFVLASITFLSVSDEMLLLLGTGACGSFTTFSSFSVDVIQLWEDGRYWIAFVYAGMNIGGALLAIAIAYVLTLFV